MEYVEVTFGEFQFLIGKITTVAKISKQNRLSTFQFLIGKITTPITYFCFAKYMKFQFLIGKITTACLVEGTISANRGFNSS